MLISLFGLSVCGGKDIQDRPEDSNVSLRSREAYDPTYEALENDPVEGKKQH